MPLLKIPGSAIQYESILTPPPPRATTLRDNPSFPELPFYYLPLQLCITDHRQCPTQNPSKDLGLRHYYRERAAPTNMHPCMSQLEKNRRTLNLVSLVLIPPARPLRLKFKSTWGAKNQRNQTSKRSPSTAPEVRTDRPPEPTPENSLPAASTACTPGYSSDWDHRPYLLDLRTTSDSLVEWNPLLVNPSPSLVNSNPLHLHPHWNSPLTKGNLKEHPHPSRWDRISLESSNEFGVDL